MSEIDAVSGDLASMLSNCTVRQLWAEQDEGPYHLDGQPRRRDIVEDREGVALQLGIRLSRDRDGPPPGGTVEVWHCDALGRYSGFPPPDSSAAVTAETAPRGEYVADRTFLRGSQRIDGAGMVEFRTIFPGWYPGRTVHIHVMVHADDVVLTSQLYFPDDVSNRVLVMAPYAARPGRNTTNATDEIFATGGDPAVLDVSAADDGYRAAVCLVVPSA